MYMYMHEIGGIEYVYLHLLITGCLSIDLNAYRLIGMQE